MQCPRFPFGAKGASAGAEYRGIRQRFPYRRNKTKASRTEVIVGAAAEHAVIRKPPSRIVWPVAKAPLAMVPSLKTGRGILPDCDGIEELSMKAPMSVSKLADLG